MRTIFFLTASLVAFSAFGESWHSWPIYQPQAPGREINGGSQPKGHPVTEENLLAYPKGPNDPNFDQNFVTVEKGSFQMGSEFREKDRDEDEKLHRVEIKNSYQIGKTEVTQKLFLEVMGYLPKDIKIKGENLPVTQVTYKDAKLFFQKLKELRGNDGYVYRFPTEAEWEYAARGGHKVRPIDAINPFSFGKDVKDIVYYASVRENSSTGPKKVGSYLANPLGLWDMHGNVSEWVRDKYNRDYDKATTLNPTQQPINLAEGEGRVIRGGSWFGQAKYGRSANRDFAGEDDKWDSVGFRVVREKEVKRTK